MIGIQRNIRPVFTQVLRQSYHSPASRPLPKITTLNLGFSDSGVGGLFFMMDSMKTLCKFLLSTSTTHNVQFSATHLGDAHNAPYGLNTPLEIKQLTQGAIRHLTEVEHCQMTVIACDISAASVLSDATHPDHSPESEPHLIFPIRHAANQIYSMGRLVPNHNTLEIHVGILSSLTTAASQVYPQQLAHLHCNRYGPESITVVPNYRTHSRITIDTSLYRPFVRVYQGSKAILPHSHLEGELVGQVSTRSTATPVLFVHGFAPVRWTSMIGASSPELGTEVHHDMSQFLTQLPTDQLSALSGLFLCSTPFVAARHLIETELSKVGLPSIPVVDQANYVAEHGIQPAIQRAIEHHQIERRPLPASINAVPPIRLFSKTPIDSSILDDTALDLVKTAAAHYDPEMAATIRGRRLGRGLPSAASTASSSSLEFK